LAEPPANLNRKADATPERMSLRLNFVYWQALPIPVERRTQTASKPKLAIASAAAALVLIALLAGHSLQIDAPTQVWTIISDRWC